MCNGCSWLWVSGAVSRLFRLSRHAPRPCYATCPRCTWCTLHPPFFCQDTVDPFGEFTSTFRRQKVGAAAAAKFIRLKFAGNYLSK